MNATTLQRWLDEVVATSLQQWLLRLVAVGAPLLATIAAGVASGRWLPFWIMVMMGFALASAFRPDAHSGLPVVLIAGLLWVLTVDELDTPWLPVAALCLLVFHAITALLASLPVGGAFPATILVREATRVGLVAAATVAMWGLVVAFDRRASAGNGLLTGLSLAIVAVAAAAIRRRSLQRPADDR